MRFSRIYLYLFTMQIIGMCIILSYLAVPAIRSSKTYSRAKYAKKMLDLHILFISSQWKQFLFI